MVALFFELNAYAYLVFTTFPLYHQRALLCFSLFLSLLPFIYVDLVGQGIFLGSIKPMFNFCGYLSLLLSGWIWFAAGDRLRDVPIKKKQVVLQKLVFSLFASFWLVEFKCYVEHFFFFFVFGQDTPRNLSRRQLSRHLTIENGEGSARYMCTGICEYRADSSAFSC